jgi:rhamnosyltransferase
MNNVAVLLAAYNGTDFIEQQLESILQQKYVVVTIFISVDISIDGTYEWCCNYAKDKINIYLLPYGEIFGGAAPNFFRLIKDVDFSKFDYVALADQDDVWLDDKLATACKSIKQHNVDAYSSNVLAFWSDGSEQLIVKSQPQRKYDYLFEAAGPGCTYVMRVKPLLKFKEMLLSNICRKQVELHDWLLYAFFRSSGYKWLIDSKYKMRYRQHADNQMGINNGVEAALKRIEFLKTGWYKKQISIVVSLVGEDSKFFSSRWFLLKNITHLRRRFRDRQILFFLILLGWY